MIATRLLYLKSTSGADGSLALLDPAGQPSNVGNAGTAALNTLEVDLGPYFASLPGGRTIYAATGSDGRQEPWITDGTAGGTHRITAIGTGSFHSFYLYTGRDTRVVKGSAAQDFTALDTNRVLFVADDGTHGLELWITDGTEAGTRLVSDVNAGLPGAQIGQVTALGDGRALFKATDANKVTGLWVTDGTAAGTSLVSSFGQPAGVPYGTGFVPINPISIVATGRGTAILAAVDADGYGLWTTDGTASGTRRFFTTGVPYGQSPGAFGLPISGLTRLGNGTVLFLEQNTAYGRDLWVTDGTAAGTHRLMEAENTGSKGPLSTSLGLLGDGRAVFSQPASNSSQVQLWVTDGTRAGTVLLRDGGPAGFFNIPAAGVTLADGRLAFVAAASTGMAGLQVWTTDGTAAGTQLLGGSNAAGTVGGLSGAGLVDAPFYYAQYTDVAAAGVNSATHYHASGWHEGRDPDAYFSTAGYLNQYEDIKAAGVDPLTHYDAQGWKEGRDPSAAFDTNLYLLFNPDVKAAGIDPLQHWLADGQVEGRKMSAVVDGGRITDLFDPTFYGLGNSDVTASGTDLLTHFNSYGVGEGRNPDAYFDVKYYLAQNPDVAASGINPVAHYLAVGWKEGRDPSTHFSTTKYLAAYADVRAAGVNPLQHFLASGIIEGRSGFGDRI